MSNLINGVIYVQLGFFIVAFLMFLENKRNEVKIPKTIFVPQRGD